MKNILLIGGSHGIGQALLEKLANQHQIWVACRSEDFAHKNQVNHIPFDILQGDFPIEQLPEKLDGFVYLPGTIQLKPFKNLKPEQFQQDFEYNFLKMVGIVQAILPRLLQSSQASIVLYSSVAATTGMPFHTSVAASKAAIEGFAKSFAAEFAPKIRTNVVAPSLTDTPLAEKFLNNDIKKEKSAERHPLKRVGTTNDIANISAFLLSEDSSWITGQVFGVDGGMSTLNTQM